MAAISVGETHGRGLFTQGTTTWTTKVTRAAANFTAGGKYLLIVTGLVGGSSTASTYGLRVAHGATVFATSYHIVESDSGSSASLSSYGWFGVFDQPGGGAEDIVVQLRLEAGTGSANLRMVQIVAMRLDADLTENTDWFLNENVANTAHTTTPADRASVTWTPGTASEDWLVLTRGRYEINDVARQCIHHTLFDGTDSLMAKSREGEDTSETFTMMQTWVEESVTAASHTVKVQSNDDGTGTANHHDTSAVFLLRLDSFESHVVKKLASPVNAAGFGSKTEIITQTYTPTTTGDQVVIGSVTFDGNNASNFGFWALQFDNVDDPANMDADLQDVLRCWGVDDQKTGNVALIRSIPSLGETIDLDGWANTLTGTPQWSDAIIVAFSAELVAAPPPPPPVSGVDAVHGIFDCPASTGVAVVTTALTFTPKAYLLWGVAVADELANVNNGGFLGMTDGASEFSIVTAAKDGGTGDTRHDVDQAKVLIVVNGDSDTRIVAATHSSFNSDGFSLNFSAVSSGIKIHWLALGGPNLTDVKVASTLVSSSPVTGLGFQPDFLVAMSAGDDLTPTADFDAYQMFGVTDGTVQWWGVSFNGRDNSNSVDSQVDNGGFIGQHGNGFQHWEATLTSFDADGFTWSGAADDGFYYMALKTGGAMSAAYTTKTTATAPAAQDLPDAGFTPGVYLLVSGSKIDHPASSPNGCGWAMGITDGVTMQHVFRSQKFNTREVDQLQDNDHVLAVGKAAGAVPDAKATVSAITDSTPTITWDPNDASADEIGVWYIQTAAPTISFVPPLRRPATIGR